ncbi:putative esterase C31F10.02 [Pseudocercospora fuligena]|uniref:Putative esterase C31F10.02 n=1 Tax=Pseudocercospora fuligena TaxID=685502 RepID=A0A8H6RBA2_9PEZI|nr:putative esterase C31F10.02 [Pseudocercospora fuligena]
MMFTFVVMGDAKNPIPSRNCRLHVSRSRIYSVTQYHSNNVEFKMFTFCEVGMGVFSCQFRIGTELRVTAARPGTVNFELDIKKEHTNRLQILHGGTIASMVDLGGSLAVASRGLFATGVSTDLNVTYLNSGGKVGDRIRAEVTCDKFGKTLAYTSIKFMNDKDELVARGSHTKYVSLAWKDPNNIVEELSPREGEKK